MRDSAPAGAATYAAGMQLLRPSQAVAVLRRLHMRSDTCCDFLPRFCPFPDHPVHTCLAQRMQAQATQTEPAPCAGRCGAPPPCAELARSWYGARPPRSTARRGAAGSKIASHPRPASADPATTAAGRCSPTPPPTPPPSRKCTLRPPPSPLCCPMCCSLVPPSCCVITLPPLRTCRSRLLLCASAARAMPGVTAAGRQRETDYPSLCAECNYLQASSRLSVSYNR